ncbi:MAG: hypothetical protein IID08_07730 [Candidatus Hydrogenedentes bacterium]|nr:hypothetical protein [Candidatus Hydrogenedentota bacterium]
MSHAAIEKALACLQSDAPNEAAELVRPLLTVDETRGDALHVLGLYYERAENLATACYLFEEAVRAESGSEALAGDLARCQKALAKKGLTEDFADAGHTGCTNCALFYRAEYPLCPYCCDIEGNSESVEETANPPEDEPELHPWEDTTAMERLQSAGHDLLERTKELAEHENVKEVTKRVEELGREASQKVKKVLESDTIHEATAQIRKGGGEALTRTRQFVKSERDKYADADDEKRKTIIAKWVMFGIVFLIFLKVLAWIF